MDLNIDLLDSEERKKINALLKERNDSNKNKGVEYIFRQPDEKEEFLLGKKIDLNKVVKDDKSLMGESEIEFQERMEKRKLMQKMREDPMAIIQLKEQEAQKVAMEKQKVRQKLSRTYNLKFQRKRSVSSSESDSSDCLEQLRKLLEKHVDNEDSDTIGNILNQINPCTESSDYSTKKQRSKSPKNDRKRKKSRESSPVVRKHLSKKHSSRTHNKEERTSKRRKRSKSISPGTYKYQRHLPRKQNRDRSRSKPSDLNSYKQKPTEKSQLSHEEKERRLQEMRDNARELDSRIDHINRKFKNEDDREAKYMKRHQAESDRFMFQKLSRLTSHRDSLRTNLQDHSKQTQINKFFNRMK